MSRLDDLRAMRDFLTREIAAELDATASSVEAEPAVRAVANLYDVPVENILSGDRRHNATRARHAAIWLLFREGYTAATLAQAFGYSDSSGPHGAQRRVDNNPAMRALLLGLEVA